MIINFEYFFYRRKNYFSKDSFINVYYACFIHFIYALRIFLIKNMQEFIAYFIFIFAKFFSQFVVELYFVFIHVFYLIIFESRPDTGFQN